MKQIKIFQRKDLNFAEQIESLNGLTYHLFLNVLAFSCNLNNLSAYISRCSCAEHEDSKFTQSSTQSETPIEILLS